MALLEDLGVRGVDRSELISFLSVGFPWHEHAVSHERLFAGCSYWDYMGGDNYVCDYLGARSAGLQAVWFDRSPEHPRADECKDRICCLSELPAIVERARSRRRSKGCG